MRHESVPSGLDLLRRRHSEAAPDGRRVAQPDQRAVGEFFGQPATLGETGPYGVIQAWTPGEGATAWRRYASAPRRPGPPVDRRADGGPGPHVRTQFRPPLRPGHRRHPAAVAFDPARPGRPTPPEVSDLPITAIARRCGFGAALALRHHFTRHLGLPPRRHAHSVQRIRVDHGIAHAKNRRSLARHHGRREHLADTTKAAAVLLSHQQAATHSAERQGQPGRSPGTRLAPTTMHEVVRESNGRC